MKWLLSEKSIIAWLSFSSFCLFSTVNIAQSLDAEVFHLNEANGLIEDDINAFVFQDSRGFIWISAMNGCYRFDGQHLRYFNLANLGDCGRAIVSQFYEDDYGSVFFSSSDCLYTYSISEDKIDYINLASIADTLEAGLNTFHLDSKKNTLWLSNSKYTWRINTKTKALVPPLLKGGHIRFLPLDAESGNTEFLGLPWLISKGGEHWSISEDSLTKTTFTDSILNSATLSGGVVDRNKQVWLFSDVGLIEYVNPEFGAKAYSPERLDNKGITSGVVLNDSILLVSTQSNGLVHFNIHSKSFSHRMVADSMNRKSLQSNSILGLFTTGSKWIWATQVGKGLDYFQVENATTVRKSILPVNEEYLDAVVTSEHCLYALTSKSAVIKYDLQEESVIKRYELGKIDLEAASITIDSTGIVWVLEKDIIYKLNPKTDLITNIRLPDILRNRLYRIIHTDSEHILFGVDGAWSIDGTELTNVTSMFSSSQYLEEPIYKISKGTYVLPVDGVRLDFYNIANGILKKTQELLINSNVNDICFHPERKELLIASSRGLHRVKKRKGAWTLSKTEVPERKFEQVLLDKQGTTWSLSNGLIGFAADGHWRFNDLNKNPLKNKYATSLHALQNIEGVGLLSSTGLYSITKREIRKESTGVKPYFSEIHVDDRLIQDKASPEVDTILLQGKNHKIEFYTRTLNALDSKDLKYEYRVEGLINSWTSFNPKEYIKIEGLLPGEYVIKTRITDSYNRVGPTNKVFILIRPPFYQTTWFWLLVVTLLAAIVYAITAFLYHRKLLQERKKLARQQLITEERDRIAGELHDELGSDLSSIRFLSEDLASGYNNGQAGRISELSKGAIEHMRDIIWALNSEEGSIQNLSNRFQDFSDKYGKQHQLSLSYIAEFGGNESKSVSSQTKRNLFLIFRELLQNILKHANATTVNVKFKVTPIELILVVTDDGKGFDLERNLSTGYGLQNIKRRVEQLSGKIDISSAKKGGTATTIRVPLELKSYFNKSHR